MKMGKLSESAGVWTYSLLGMDEKEIELSIIPEEQDNIDFVEIKKKAEKAKDEKVLTEGVADLFYNMVIRSNKDYDQKDKTLLKNLIGLSVTKIVTDFLVKFRWTTQEKLNEIEDRQWKLQEEITKKKAMLELETSQREGPSKKTS